MRAGAGLRGGVVLLRAFCVPAGMSCVRSRRSCGSIGLFCARSRRSCVPVEMSCVRLMSVVRFYWDVLAFVRACHTFLSGCLMFDHACCLPPVRQTERLAICCVPIPPWVVIAGSSFSNRLCGYPALLVHFGTVRFLMAIPTENEGTGDERDAGDGERSRRWGVSALLRDRIGFAMFPAGSPLGAARPRLRQRAIGSLDSLHLGRGVGAFHAGKGIRVQRRLERLALVLRLSYVPIGMSYVRSRLLFAA